jgi:hypothetical protein
MNKLDNIVNKNDPELAKAEKCLELAKLLNPGQHYSLIQETAAYWMDLSMDFIDETLKKLRKE